MQFIQNILSANQILTASLLSWFIAQVLKTIINFILLVRADVGRWWYAQRTQRDRLRHGYCDRAQRRGRLADFCGGLCGSYHHHARCHGRPARDR